MTDYRIYCCTHVPTTTIDDRLYTPIQTGRAFDGYTIDGMIGDDTGDNISLRKDAFDGMVTGMYWIWKNTHHDIVGLCSYRAYFESVDNRPICLEDLQYIFEETGADFLTILKTPPSVENPLSVAERMRISNYAPAIYHNFLYNPWNMMRDTILEYFHDYLDAFNCVSHGYAANYGNLFVTRREHYNAYCEWLFDLLAKYEIYLKNRKYPYPYFARFLGHLAERLLRVWLLMQRIKVVETRRIFINTGRDGEPIKTGSMPVNWKQEFDYGGGAYGLYNVIF